MRVVSSIIRSGYLWKFYHNYQLRHMKTLDKQQEIDFSVCLRKETKLIGKQTIVTEKEFVIPVISPSHCFSHSQHSGPRNILRYIFDNIKPLNAQLSAFVCLGCSKFLVRVRTRGAAGGHAAGPHRPLPPLPPRTSSRADLIFSNHL